MVVLNSLQLEFTYSGGCYSGIDRDSRRPLTSARWILWRIARGSR